MEKYTDYVFGLRFKEFPTICLWLHSDELTNSVKEMQYIVVVKIFQVEKIILILGIWGPNVLFNVYNLQNIWHFSIFIENTLYVQLVSCRNRTVGFYEEKLKKALESYIFWNNRSNHYLYKLQKGFGRLFLRHYNYR